jgi:hypothetical protein
MASRTRDQEHPLVVENRILQTRLRLAQAFNGLMQAAFDALLTHGVNYRTLPEYKDDGLLDAALGNGVTIERGEANIMSWIERATNGISAAIRRKRFRRLDS